MPFLSSRRLLPLFFRRIYYGRVASPLRILSSFGHSSLGGCIIVSVCCLCMLHEETSEHLFLRCPFATTIWNWIGIQLQFAFDCSSFEALLLSLPQNRSAQVRDIFVATAVHTLHSIWLARNSMHFSSTVPSLHAVQLRVQAATSMSGNLSVGKCVASDTALLDAFSISPHNRQFRDIILVSWKAPSAPWFKVNTDGSVVGSSGACGGLFRDHSGAFLGAYACNIGNSSVFFAEVYGYILAMEYAANHGWRNIWLESDSTSALAVFKNTSLVPVLLRNRWHNACNQGIQVICSHIFREGNCCADLLANMGHSLHDSMWFSVMPHALLPHFFRDRRALPNFRFP